MTALSETELAKARKLQVQNILKKQAAGKVLTAREERTLAAAAADTPVGAENFVTTYDELAKRLNISRFGLQKVCHRFPNEFPTALSDGRHDVTAWLNFFLAKNIKGAQEDIATDDDQRSVKDWKAEEVKLKCTRLELENAKAARELVDVAEMEAGVSAMVAAFRQALNNLPARLALKVTGVTDYHEAEELATEECNNVLRTLQRCDFLTGVQATIPAATSTQHAEDDGVEAPPAKRKPKKKHA